MTVYLSDQFPSILLFIKMTSLHYSIQGVVCKEGQNMTNDINSMISVAEILKALPTAEIQHMRRVGRLVDCFTKNCDFTGSDSDENQNFGNAAFYHDIGKAWVPYDILTKPDKLTKPETCVIRNHPVFAQRLFEKIRLGLIFGMPEHLIQLAADSATYHHEWWNGTGYPYGIEENEIPLIARITSICDAYDAMTSNRIYQKSHSHNHTYQEFKRCAGIQFDPELVSAFLDMVSDSVFFRNALPSYL